MYLRQVYSGLKLEHISALANSWQDKPAFSRNRFSLTVSMADTYISHPIYGGTCEYLQTTVRRYVILLIYFPADNLLLQDRCYGIDHTSQKPYVSGFSGGPQGGDVQEIPNFRY